MLLISVERRENVSGSHQGFCSRQHTEGSRSRSQDYAATLRIPEYAQFTGYGDTERLAREKLMDMLDFYMRKVGSESVDIP